MSSPAGQDRTLLALIGEFQSEESISLEDPVYESVDIEALSQLVDSFEDEFEISFIIEGSRMRISRRGASRLMKTPDGGSGRERDCIDLQSAGIPPKSSSEVTNGQRFTSSALTKWERVSKGYQDTDPETFLVTKPDSTAFLGHSWIEVEPRTLIPIRQSLFAVEEFIEREIVPKTRMVYDPCRKYQYVALNSKLATIIGRESEDVTIAMNASDRRALHDALTTLEYLQNGTEFAKSAPSFREPEIAPSPDRLESIRRNIPLPPERIEAFSDIYTLSGRLEVISELPEYVKLNKIGDMFQTSESRLEDSFGVSQFIRSRLRELYEHRARDTYFPLLIECIVRLQNQRHASDEDYPETVDLLWLCIEYILRVGYDRGLLQAVERLRISFAVRQVVTATHNRLTTARDRVHCRAICWLGRRSVRASL